MRRISTCTTYTTQAPIQPQEIVEISPDDSTEGFKCIAVQMEGFRCDACDCMRYNSDRSMIVCVMPFEYNRLKLCSEYHVCMKSLDKVMEDL